VNYITPNRKQFGGDIQKCIDYALGNGYPTVYIPKGVYEIEEIIIQREGQAVINITGEPVAYTQQPATTVIKTNGIKLSTGKGCNISNLQILGSGKYGVSIDEFLRPGSTDNKFENLYIDGFEVGIGVGVSGQAQNSDCNIFDRIWVANAKVAMAFGHTQCRSNVVRDLKCWTGVETVFDCINYGQGTGDLPSVYGGNFVNCYQLFLCNNQYATGSFNDVYAEALYRIGDAFGGWLPITFNDCHIDLDTLKGFPENIITGNNIQFNGGLIRYYDNSGEWKPMNVNAQTNNSGKVSFNGTYLNNPVSFGNDADYPENVSYNNVRFANGKNYNSPVFTQTYSEYYGYTKGIFGNSFEMADWAENADHYYEIGQPVISRHGVVGIVERMEGKTVTLKNTIKIPEGTQVGYQKPMAV
jgi:hypothetical protein